MNVDPITGATRFLLDETALKASELASEAGDGLASYRLFEHHQKGLGDLVRAFRSSCAARISGIRWRSTRWG